MIPGQVVIIPVPVPVDPSPHPVAGQTWSRRTPLPAYPAQPPQRPWPPHQAIPRQAHDEAIAVGKRYLAERRAVRESQRTNRIP
jgi:hypothetical protein